MSVVQQERERERVCPRGHGSSSSTNYTQQATGKVARTLSCGEEDWKGELYD